MSNDPADRDAQEPDDVDLTSAADDTDEDPDADPDMQRHGDTPPDD